MLPNKVLISADELNAILDEAFVIDARHQLADKDWGRKVYLQSHIRGAHFFDLENAASGAKTGKNGRHPLPNAEAFIALLIACGLQDRQPIVVYDQDQGMMASRIWWMIRHWLGYPPVAVLDGGWAAWQSARYPTTTQTPPQQPSQNPPSFNPQSNKIATLDEILADLDRTSAKLLTLIDARAPERYCGKSEPIDKVAGHIPFALNHFCGTNINAEGRFRSPEELSLLWQDEVHRARGTTLVHQCGSGVSACHNWLAMEYAGFDMRQVQLYIGSWSEYCANPNHPIATEH